MSPAQLPCTFDKLVEIVSVYAQKCFALGTKNKLIYFSSKFFTSGKVSSDTKNAVLKTVPMIFSLNPKFFCLKSKKTKLNFFKTTSPKMFSRTISMHFRQTCRNCFGLRPKMFRSMYEKQIYIFFQ